MRPNSVHTAAPTGLCAGSQVLKGLTAFIFQRMQDVLCDYSFIMRQNKVQYENFKWGAMFNPPIHIYLRSRECFARRLLCIKRLSDTLTSFQVNWHGLLCSLKWSFIEVAAGSAGLLPDRSVFLMHFCLVAMSSVRKQIIAGHLYLFSFSYRKVTVSDNR